MIDPGPGRLLARAAHRRRVAVIAILAAGAIGDAARAEVGAEVGADVSILAGTCATCHGPDGRSPGAIPGIAGQPQAVLRAQLEAFRAGEPATATVMPRLMRGVSLEEIDALATWFSQVTP